MLLLNFLLFECYVSKHYHYQQPHRGTVRRFHLWVRAAARWTLPFCGWHSITAEFSPLLRAEWRMIWLSLECASLRTPRRKWNGSGEMREVNEMYLRLNTLRDRFGIGPLIKNHSGGEVMRRDGVRSEDSFSTSPYSREPSGGISPLLLVFSTFCLVIISRKKATS